MGFIQYLRVQNRCVFYLSKVDCYFLVVIGLLIVNVLKMGLNQVYGFYYEEDICFLCISAVW